MIELVKRDGTKDKLVVYFSGKQPDYSSGHFHFMGSGYNAGFESVFIRDTSNTWYSGANYQEIVEELNSIISTFSGPCVFVGSSMGGYGALKFGLHCLPNKVLAFSPQVATEFFFIDLPDLYEIAEKRPEVEIHLCNENNNPNWDDIGSAMRMNAFAKVVTHKCNGHNCAEILKDRKEILNLIIGA